MFAGKLTIAAAGLYGGLAWLAVAVLINTAPSLYYYLRWIAPAYRGAQPGAPTPARSAPRPPPWWPALPASARDSALERSRRL